MPNKKYYVVRRISLYENYSNGTGIFIFNDKDDRFYFKLHQKEAKKQGVFIDSGEFDDERELLAIANDFVSRQEKKGIINVEKHFEGEWAVVRTDSDRVRLNFYSYF